MLRAYRIWRMLRLIRKENRKIGYKDPVLVGIYRLRPYKCVQSKKIIDKFRVFSRSEQKRQYIAENIYKSAKAKDLLDEKNTSPVLVELDFDKGEDMATPLGLVKLVLSELKFYEELAAFLLTSSILYGIYELLLKLINKI